MELASKENFYCRRKLICFKGMIKKWDRWLLGIIEVILLKMKTVQVFLFFLIIFYFIFYFIFFLFFNYFFDRKYQRRRTYRVSFYKFIGISLE